MSFRLAVPLIGFGLVIAGCGAEAPGAGGDSASAVPVDRLQMSDIVDAAQDSTVNNEQLADICSRLYADAEVDQDLTVGLVADVASIDDGTFNQAAFEGMEAAGRCFGVATTFLESAGDDAAAQIESMVNQDVDIVVTVGFQFHEATAAAAKARPDLRFVGVDQTNPEALPNYVGISFQNQQVGFLAGVTAALLSESGTVAIVAGPDTVPPVVAIADGFENGVRHVSTDVTVLRAHLESFVDSRAGASQAEEFVAAGADVVFGAAGDSGTGAIMSAAGSGAMVIGVDQDEYFTTFAGGAASNSQQLVTSAIKRVDLGVFLTLAAMAGGPVEGGGFLLDASNGGVTYAPFHEAEVSDDVAARIEGLRLQLAAGDIAAAGTE